MANRFGHADAILIAEITRKDRRLRDGGADVPADR
jgi:hypothetical protein